MIFCPISPTRSNCTMDCRWWVRATDGAEDYDCSINKIAAALDGLMLNSDGTELMLHQIEKNLAGIKAEVSAMNEPLSAEMLKAAG
jgi:hypothetical protein